MHSTELHAYRKSESVCIQVRDSDSLWTERVGAEAVEDFIEVFEEQGLHVVSFACEAHILLRVDEYLTKVGHIVAHACGYFSDEISVMTTLHVHKAMFWKASGRSLPQAWHCTSAV